MLARSSRALSIACILAAFLPATSIDETPPFVRVERGDFFVGGERFRFVGANVAVMHGPDQRASAEAILDTAVQDGLSVVRVWAFGEAAHDAPAYAREYAFRIGEDRWVEESFVHLDRVLVAARERNLRVILVLANRWDDYGGIPRYVRWIEPDREPIDPLIDADLTPFWRSQRAAELYREHVVRVVGRVNSIDGTRYADDPTIFAWELFNEAAAAAPAHAALLRTVQTTAQLIRRHDTAHLIAPGHGGFYDDDGRALWTEVHRLPEIAYFDAHAYPQHEPSIDSFDRLAAWMDVRTRLTRGKPFVWGEIGFPAGHARLAPRDAWFDAFTAHALASGADGVLAWIYGPRSSSPHWIGVDDPASASVRAVLANHAARLRMRRGREEDMLRP